MYDMIKNVCFSFNEVLWALIKVAILYTSSEKNPVPYKKPRRYAKESLLLNGHECRV